MMLNNKWCVCAYRVGSLLSLPLSSINVNVNGNVGTQVFDCYFNTPLNFILSTIKLKKRYTHTHRFPQEIAYRQPPFPFIPETCVPTKLHTEKLRTYKITYLK